MAQTQKCINIEDAQIRKKVPYFKYKLTDFTYSLLQNLVLRNFHFLKKNLLFSTYLNKNIELFKN